MKTPIAVLSHHVPLGGLLHLPMVLLMRTYVGSLVIVLHLLRRIR